MDVVVLAGGVPRPGDTLYPHSLGRPKASLEVRGRAIGQRVVDALTEASAVDRIVVVGDVAVTSPKLAATVPARGGLVDNLLAGIEAVRGIDASADVLAACTSDIPLLTSAMVDWFIGSTNGCDATAGVVRRQAVEARCPAYPNTYWQLTDGEFTAVDFVVFDPSRATDLADRLRPLADARKNALRTARLIGPGLLIRLLFHRLSLHQAERAVGRVLGITVRVIDVPHPEMGLDVDEAIHLTVLETCLGP